MLKIFNDLAPFFEDNYRRIHVRNYAELIKISPPTASKLLEKYNKQKILKKDIDKKYNLFFANKDSELFKDLQRIYYKEKLTEMINYIKSETINPVLILFGSTAKAEANKDSDIDLALFTPTKKKLEISKVEKEIKRKIQIFRFANIDEVPEELKNNILNGYKLIGEF